jgi:hypothetical protein
VGAKIRFLMLFFILVTNVGNLNAGFLLSLYYAIGDLIPFALLVYMLMGSVRHQEFSGCRDFTLRHICVL